MLRLKPKKNPFDALDAQELGQMSLGMAEAFNPDEASQR